jgi:hypothetical protein
LKDDLGYVCRVCGIIDRGIETIFEFQYKVRQLSLHYSFLVINLGHKNIASAVHKS